MAQTIHGRADRPGDRLDEIDVFRVPRRWCQIELVERGPTPEGKSPGQVFVGEDLDQRSADDQILFHLRLLNPRNLLPPFGDEVRRDQRSGSRSALTRSFQRASRLAEALLAPGTSTAVSVA